MNPNKKENIAITALINEINKFDNIEDKLNKRDKEPVWDGDLYLYKNDSSKKADIVGRIPVQIKGTNSKSNNNSNTYYDVEIVDLENYRKDNKGAIYFVVEVNEDRTTKIYYKIFDLQTVENILKDKDINRKTKRFKFKQLENNELVTICIEFIKRLQIYKHIELINEVEVYNKKTLCYDHNTKYELEEIKKSNEVFYETNAYKEAKQKLEKQNIIILHGEPWVGKTSTARKLVMNYIDQGYMFVYGNVDDLLEIKQKVALDQKIICLLDDFLGSNVQYLEKNIAESTLDKIVSIFKNSKNKKLILTTRTYIYNNAKELFYKFHRATSIKDEYLIDVANYNYKEKGNILYNHMEKNNLIGTDKHIQIVTDNFYSRIISHQNFNPGVIALICEKLKDKETINIKEFIESALDTPEQLWEDEYKKLNIYEKMILTIIVLFGVKVPEKYIEEQFKQIIENEDINLLDKELFTKSIHVLSNAFIKITFNEKQEKLLEVCKHSVADFIINKIKNNKIDIDMYIKSAKYAEVLHYIDIVLYDNKDVKEKLAIKVENELNKIKGFFYDHTNIMYDILKSRLNKKRETILKDIIKEEFFQERTSLILNILEEPQYMHDPLYEFTKQKFKEYIIDQYDGSFLFQATYVSECEVFFKTCLEIFKYKKNSDYMLENIDHIIDALTEIVTEDVEATIKDIMMEYVAKEIIEGKELQDVINEYIKAVVDDDMPSLKHLYSKQYYKKILNSLYKWCYVTVDEEMLEETIEEVKQQKIEDEIEGRELVIYDNHNKVDKEQVKYIKEKFEKGILKANNSNENKINYYDLIDKDLRIQAREKWWIKAFVDENNYLEYTNIQIYNEFINSTNNIDYSVCGLAKQFLNYLLHEKNDISLEAEDLLKEIVYKNFLKGEFCISKNNIKEYKNKFSKQIKELLNANIFIKCTDGFRVINKYIFLYIAITELIKKEDNLLKTIVELSNSSPNEEIEDNVISEYEQEIFHLYSQINTKQFNTHYLMPALKIFTNDVKTRYNKIGKINVSKYIMGINGLEIELSKEFEIISILSKRYLLMSFVEFITGTDMQWDLGSFDYSIYQEEFYKKCYNPDTESYVLDFNKILKDKSLKDICNKIKIWDYIYDVYKECENCIGVLNEDSSLCLYNFSKEKITEKYFK